MSVAENIEAVVADVLSSGLSEGTVADLRQRYQGIHFTWCMDDDVCGPEPVREAKGFNVYLVDASEHCLRFTDDPEAASGFVLAEVEPDED